LNREKERKKERKKEREREREREVDLDVDRKSNMRTKRLDVMQEKVALIFDHLCGKGQKPFWLLIETFCGEFCFLFSFT